MRRRLISGRQDIGMPGEQDSLESVGDKYESYREHSKANPRCYTQTFIRTTCRVEDDAGSGLPTRKCERLIRKFEDCGRYVAVTA